ncbi:MAG: V-type ATP synthase subunit E [Lachnospiraceae bacterium]|nr:V-type ATP synthase subunit E [Lachnospiraceae bacterium]
MAGIDNIKNNILQEAKEKADALVADANMKADGIRQEAEAEKSVILDKASSRVKHQEDDYAKRIESQVELKQRQSVLATKQKIITDIVEKAYQHLAELDDAAYFDMIKRLIREAAQPQEGEVMFGEKDLARVPSGFELEIAKIASSKGGKLKVSKETADIENGFILRYAGIDENCSLRALFEEKQDILQDKVHQLLW